MMHAVISSAISLSILWALAAFLFRDYQIDALRQELFAIRDELFDYAAEGTLPFDSPAYIAVRVYINRLIRFAHKLSFFRGLISSALDPPKSASRKVFLDAYFAPVMELPEPHKKKLLEMHARVLSVVAKFLVSRSPILIVLRALLLLGRLLTGAASRLNTMLLISPNLPGIQELEAQALQSEADHGNPKTARLQPA